MTRGTLAPISAQELDRAAPSLTQLRARALQAHSGRGPTQVLAVSAELG